MNNSYATDKEKIAFKQHLKTSCLVIIEERIATIRKAILDSQESLDREEKSSVGDKYEVGRAMGHLQQEMHSNQLEEAQRELALVQALDDATILTEVGTGAVVAANGQWLFIGVGLGSATVEGQKVFLLSPIASLAVAMMGKKAGGQFTFNGRLTTVEMVF
ncbi:MAG TPA: hypothetical protein VG603_08415 [Chitinophagales bacterium]|nr:hypothetical protein [Chitinophagales bacterium]